MSYYGISQEETERHILRHIQNRIDPTETRKFYCLFCYPKPPNTTPPATFLTFWEWISSNHLADSYTAYTVITFEILIRAFQNQNPLATVTQLVYRLLQSIRFIRLVIPSEQISYYITYLFIETQ